jgi:HNH endonuclease
MSPRPNPEDIAESLPRFHILSNKKPGGWHRDPCRWPGCPRAEVRGNLCDHHHDVVLAVCRARLRPLGLTSDGVTVFPDGYLVVHLEVDGQPRFVREHRLLISAALGRELLPTENVHHLNGHRADNRLENLELWVTFQPSGQRPQDLVAYAREILARNEGVSL